MLTLLMRSCTALYSDLHQLFFEACEDSESSIFGQCRSVLLSQQKGPNNEVVVEVTR